MKRILFECVLVLIIAALALVIIKRKPDTSTYTQDVKPPVNAVEHQPQTSQQFIDAFNSPLWHKGSYDNKTHTYTGFVSDNWKNITFYDRIEPAFMQHQISAGVGVTHDFTLQYTLGYLYFPFESIGFGGYAAISNTRLESINALVSWRR
jgi:hypothetical protein